MINPTSANNARYVSRMIEFLSMDIAKRLTVSRRRHGIRLFTSLLLLS